MQRATGEYVTCTAYDDKPYRAFIPKPLPPNPPLDLGLDLSDLRDKANRALGRLDGTTQLLPDPYLFTYLYIRKEAVLSSQIEGTQSTLSQLLLFEMEDAPGVPVDDVREVLNYVKALNYGLTSIQSPGGLPISIRLLKDMHKILLEHGRGSSAETGEIRSYQNWVGGDRPSRAAFVGPPPERVTECLSDLEKFLHDIPASTPVLMKAALAHVQFETIHPFRDGNGRLGRLLITLLLCAEEALSQPMLYLSLYFKTNRKEYYDRLQKVRDDGDWEGWLRFFLTGVHETAQQAVDAAQSILKLFDNDRKRVTSLRRQANLPLRVHELLQRRPMLSIKLAASELSMSIPSVTAGLEHLERLGIVREMTGKRRNRLYMYQDYVDILNEGTKPIERDY